MPLPAKTARWARLSCGCNLDFTQSEWEVACRLPMNYWLDCPKCGKRAYMMATWRPGAFDCAEGTD